MTTIVTKQTGIRVIHEVQKFDIFPSMVVDMKNGYFHIAWSGLNPDERKVVQTSIKS